MGITKRQIERAMERKANGDKLTKEDRLLILMSDMDWHYGRELSEKVSWRFGGYLFTLKQMGVMWEKERVPEVKDAVVYKYRLVGDGE